MQRERANEMLHALEGMTYAEWQKISHIINCAFEIRLGEIKRDTHLPLEIVHRIMHTELE